jgi:hypothetical protein
MTYGCRRIGRLALTARLAVLGAGATPAVASAAPTTPTVVTSVNDSGPGSLRAAIVNSNARSGRQTAELAACA